MLPLGSGWSVFSATLEALVSSFILAGSLAPIFALPLHTTALSFLLPMTAPRPERAAMRPRSLTTPAMRDMPSPAGPMQATRAPLMPTSSMSFSSLSTASTPHRCPASRNSASPLLTSRYTGLSLAPVTRMAS